MGGAGRRSPALRDAQFPPSVTRLLGAGAVLSLLALLLLAAGVPHLPPVLTALASVAVFVAAQRAAAAAGGGTGASERDRHPQL